MQMSSNAILTKVRAIFGTRLTDADYAQMARKKDVGEVAAYLKEHSSYRRALRDIRETEVHRGRLEALLKKDTFYKYAALHRYNFSSINFYNYILVRAEIDAVLERIAALSSGSREAFIADLPSYLMHRVSFSMKALADAGSFEDLLSCLAGTPYQKLLAGLPREEGGRPDSLLCEHALYSYYYQYMFQSVDRDFSGKTRKQLRDILLCEIDARNFETIYRLRHIYKKPPEAVRPLLYPYQGALKASAREAMLQTEEAGEMIRLAKLFKEAEVPDDGFVELLTHRYRYRFEKKKLRFATDAPVAMYAFSALRSIEVQNIITVIEGVRYQIPQAEILSLLIQ